MRTFHQHYRLRKVQDFQSNRTRRNFGFEISNHHNRSLGYGIDLDFNNRDKNECSRKRL